MKLRGSMSATAMVSNLKRLAREFPDDVVSALYYEAQIEVTEMKRRTPVDTTDDAPHPGNLRNSIHAEEPTRGWRIISVTIATGQQALYAFYVHENPDVIHPIGQWKFMESVLNESRAWMGQRIAARVHFNRKTL
jgi:hypothetical protein